MAILALAAVAWRGETTVPPGLVRLTAEQAGAIGLAEAFAHRSPALEAAFDRSLDWLARPENERSFRCWRGFLTRDRARRSVDTMRRLVMTSEHPDVFEREVLRQFDVYASVGRDGRGTMLFTAYFAPEHEGTLAPTPRFRHPLFATPADPRAHTRRDIEERGRLAGGELVWLDDALAAYLVHVNGSARLRLPDGAHRCVAHTVTNERPYTSLGRLLVREGHVPADAIDLDAIRTMYERSPALVTDLMRRNERFVFFEFVDPHGWPRSGLGIPLSPEASVATDKGVFPPGGVVLVDTTLATEAEPRPFVRLMLDQDRGGAIRSPGRADLFLGVGASAGRRAGRQIRSGRMYYFWLK